MTAAQVHVSGRPRVVGLKPTDTNEATIFTSNDNNTVLVGLWVANLTGSAANATIKWGDGSTDYSIIDTYSLAARSYFSETPFIPMRSGYTIKVTSGTGSALTFSITIVEGGSAFGARPSA